MKIEEYEHIEYFIDMIIKGLELACILISEGGLGKSYMVRKMLKEHCKPGEYVIHSGYITPLALYILMWKNLDKIIVLDDVDGVFKNSISVSILKSALWDVEGDGKREVTWASTTDKLGDTPQKFIFTGRVIILCNKISRKYDPEVRALRTRGLVIEMELTHAEKLRIFKQLIDEETFYEMMNIKFTKKDKEKLKKDLEGHTSVVMENFNFRTVKRLIGFFMYGKKYHPDKPDLHIRLHQATTKVDEENQVIWELMHTELTRDEQAKKYSIIIGKSRTTYYRKSSKLQEQMKGHKKKEKKLDEVSKYHKKDMSEPANDSDKITVDQLLNKIHQLDLDIKKIKKGYISIKHNECTLCYVRDTEYGIAWEHRTIEGWENEKIRTKDQLDAAIDQLRNRISKPNQERIPLVIGDEILYEFLDAVKQVEPPITIIKGDDKYQYNLLIENVAIAKVVRRKDGKLKFKWVAKNEMRGMILNGRKDYSKVLDKIKNLTDIHTKRSDLNKWL